MSGPKANGQLSFSFLESPLLFPPSGGGPREGSNGEACEGAASVSAVWLPPPSHVCLVEGSSDKRKTLPLWNVFCMSCLFRNNPPGADMNIHQSTLGTGASLHAMYANPSKHIPGELPG